MPNQPESGGTAADPDGSSESKASPPLESPGTKVVTPVKPAEEAVDEAELSAVDGFRNRVRRIVVNKWFDRIVLLVIFMNCAFLATSDPTDKDDESPQNRMLATADLVFQVLYTIEMVLKLVGLRMWGAYNAYFQDGWNSLDFVLVVAGWITYIPFGGSGASDNGLGSIRVVRVLRPLRTINSVEGLRMLIDSMLASLPQLCNVMGLCAFIFFVFGIVGLQLFGGRMDQRCHYPAVNGSVAEMADVDDDGVLEILCSVNAKVGRQCPEIGGIQTVCMRSGITPNGDITNFDNILTAFLTIFQCITLEGWVDVMYWAEEITTGWTSIYFLLLVTFGSLFLLNLVVAVITLNLSNERHAKVKRSQADRWATVASTQGGGPASTADTLVSAIAQTYANQAEELEETAGQDPITASKMGLSRSMTAEGLEEQRRLGSPQSGRGSKLPRSATAQSLQSKPGSRKGSFGGKRGARVAPETSAVGRANLTDSDPRVVTFSHDTPTNRRTQLEPLDGVRPPPVGADSVTSPHRKPLPSVLSADASFEETKEASTKRVVKVEESEGGIADGAGHATNTAAAAAMLERAQQAIHDGDVRRAMESVSHAWQGLATMPGAPSPRSAKKLVHVDYPPEAMEGDADSAETDSDLMSDDGDWDNSHEMERFKPSASAGPWRKLCFSIAQHPAFNAFIMILIVVNTVMLASEHHMMPQWLVTALQTGNLALTMLFLAEMVLKVSGYSLEGYVSDGFNVFDGSIVIISLLELVTAGSGGSGSGVSALRSFRLLRVFKLARSWTSLNELLSTTMSTLPKLGPFTVVLLLFMFVYSLLGMQLFGGNLGTGDDLPRAHYDDLLASFVTTFQILGGENWNEVMYDTVKATGWGATLYFISLVCVGSYVVLNLFLGILIDNFCNDDDDEDEAREMQAEEALAAAVAEAEARLTSGEGAADSAQDTADAAVQAGGDSALSKKMEEARKEHIRNLQEKKALAAAQAKQVEVNAQQAEKRRRFDGHPSYEERAFFLFRGDSAPRNALGRLVMNATFDGLILLLIAFSCILLAVDASTPKTGSGRETVDLLDTIVTMLFAVEMALKLFAFGVFAHPGSYWRDPWNCLDGCIVVVSFVDMGLQNDGLQVLKIIRFTRALRPLRMVRRLEGLRVVVNAVLKAVPNCVHVVMVSLLFFVIFSILGVNFFGGRFYSCTDESKLCNPAWASDCTAALACNGTWVNPANGLVEARAWVNPMYGTPSLMHAAFHFDHVGAGMLTLFEVATLELWLDVMNRASDVTRVGWAPERDANRIAVFFFIAFVVVASFFILNLFVTIVVDNFSKMKAKVESGGSVFMTAKQRQWVEMQRLVARQKPSTLEAPQLGASGIRVKCFHVATNAKFELFIMAAIVLNIVCMALWFDGQPQWYDDTLKILNYMFGGLFIVEAALKMVGLGVGQYFSSFWNQFDFTVVSLTILTWVLESTGSSIGIDFQMLRIVRVVRVFRLVKTSKRLRTIFTTLMLSLPALGNVGTLLLMLFFMYAVAGQTLFGDVPEGDWITEHANFNNFYRAFLLLFRMSTGESWNGVMHDCAVTVDTWIVVFYFTSFVILGQFMMLNLFVAVILENFEHEMEAENDVNNVKPQDMELFALAWARIQADEKQKKEHELGYPIKAKREWMRADLLVNLLYDLPPPLGIDNFLRENKAYMMRTIRVLDIPLNDKHEIHYHQTLRALTRRVVGENLPSDVDQVDAPRYLEHLAPQLTEFSTAHLFAARLMSSWMKSVLSGRKARRELEERGIKTQTPSKFKSRASADMVSAAADDTAAAPGSDAAAAGPPQPAGAPVPAPGVPGVP